MKRTETLKNKLFITATVLLFSAIAFSLFDAFTSWELSGTTVITSVFDNLAAAFAFQNPSISVLFYITTLISITLIITSIILCIKSKRKFPVLESIVFPINFISVILYFANFMQFYNHRLLSGNLITFLISILLFLSFFLFIPITYLNLTTQTEVSSIDDNAVEDDETVILTDEDASPARNTVIVSADSSIKTTTTKTRKLTETTRIYKRPGCEHVSELPTDHFVRKLYEAEANIREVYNNLKHAFLSYGLKSNVSRTGETFRQNRIVYAKITITGKNIKVYYALKPADYVRSTTPYSLSNVAGYKHIPVLYKLNDMQSFNKAVLLVDEMCSALGFIKEELLIQDYYSETVNLI